MKKKTTNLFILMVTSVLAAATFYVLMYKKTNSLFNELKEIKTRIETADAKNREMESVRRDMKATLGDYEKIQATFISADGVVDFIQMLESLGKEIGIAVEIESVKNEELEPALPSRENLTVSVEAQGSREKLLKFQRLLEVLPNALSFKHVSLGKTEDRHTTGADNKTIVTPGAWKLVADISVIKIKTPQ